MVYHDNNPQISNDTQPGLSLLKLIGVIIVSFFITQFAGLLILYVRGIDLTTFVQVMSNPSLDTSLARDILVFQGIYSFGLFIFSSLLYIYGIEKLTFSSLNGESLQLIPLVLGGIIVLVSMPFNSWIIEWNQNLSLPEFLKGFENWAREKEETASELIKMITAFNTVTDFILAFLIIAVFAGIGEELLFRGLLQNKLLAVFNNPHVAIILTAILFSLFHLQFFGFFPRILLGVLFGYLYYWSKNIWVPIFAHFVNNAIQVVAIYLYNIKVIEANIEEASKATLSLFLASLVITAALMFSFWKYYSGKRLLQ